MAVDGQGGAVDFGYLERFAAGDLKVVNEILALFLQEAESWALRLADGQPAWRDAVHTIKGSSRGIGAVALGDACQAAEDVGEAGLPAVRAGLAAVVAAITAYRARWASQASSS